MPKEYGRNRRVADLIQRELAVLIQREVVDARLGMITISTVDVSPDLKNAKIYVTSLGAEADNEEVIMVLNEHAAHLRHELAKVVVLRGVPKLIFVFDSSIERGSHLTALIDSLNKNSASEDK